jgi:hypothetical protein
MYIFLAALVFVAAFSGFPFSGYRLQSVSAATPVSDQQPYNIGTPNLHDIWVDPVRGNNNNTGATRLKALRTLDAAWNRIPQGVVFNSTGYRIMLVSGTYASSTLPVYMESRYGTFNCPIIIQNADTAHPQIHGYLNIYDTKYLYLIGVDFVTDRGYGGGGNVIHYEKCSYVLIRNCKLNGFDGRVQQPQETLKVNQTQYIYVENSEICGAFWFALDFMAVQYGHILGCTIHNTGDDVVVIKGGSAGITLEANEIYDGQTVGFTAGQGSGLEFLVPPWIHYDAYNIKFINNIVRQIQNAGMAVRGGYNIVLAYNTLYDVGTAGIGAPLLLLSPGTRGCGSDDVAVCQRLHNLGGWGVPAAGDGIECVPNRDVYVYSNIFYNASPQHTVYSHFGIFGPADAPAGSNIPSPVQSDTNLRIWGNMIWNGPATMPLGIEDEGNGCQPDNPTCNQTQLRTDNTINSLKPAFKAVNNFHPVAGGSIFHSSTYAIPSLPGNDRPSPPLAPQGELTTNVTIDKDSNRRTSTGPPGAFIK